MGNCAGFLATLVRCLRGSALQRNVAPYSNHAGRGVGVDSVGLLSDAGPVLKVFTDAGVSQVWREENEGWVRPAIGRGFTVEAIAAFVGFINEKISADPIFLSMVWKDVHKGLLDRGTIPVVSQCEGGGTRNYPDVCVVVVFEACVETR